MAIEPDRAYAPTSPNDVNDPPRFGQILETTKDLVVEEIKKFLSGALTSTARRIELPTIEKYTSFTDNRDPFSTVARVLQKLPDIAERLPHIAVSAAQATLKPSSMSVPIWATVQDPPQFSTIVADTFALEDGDLLVFQITQNSPRSEVIKETVKFYADRFPVTDPIGAAVAVDIARVINEQSHVLEAAANEDGSITIAANCDPTARSIIVSTDSSDNALTVLGLGKRGTPITIDATTSPHIKVTATSSVWSSADIGRYIQLADTQYAFRNDGIYPITAFSTNDSVDTLTFTNKYAKSETVPAGTEWFIGKYDSDRNSARPPKRRYMSSWKVSLTVDILTEDENTRNELTDLLLSFFGFFLEEKFFTFWGRTGFEGQTADTERLQLCIEPGIRSSAENEIPRPGDNSGKVYMNSFSLDTTLWYEMDRTPYIPGTTDLLQFDSSNLVNLSDM